MPSLTFSTIYLKIWQGLCAIEKDPYVEVAALTKVLTDYIRNKAKDLLILREPEMTRTYTYSSSSNDSMERSMLAAS